MEGKFLKARPYKEELNFEGRRIIRPAYKNILGELDYTPLGER